MVGLSLPPVAQRLIQPLEGRARVMDPGRLPMDLWAVVVLGGGVDEGTGLPPASRLNPGTIKRLAEGVRLWRARPRARLIVSGGSWVEGLTREAEVMAAWAVELGVPEDLVITLTP